MQEFIVFGLSFLALLWAGRIVPRAIASISKIFHLSEFLMAFFLLAFATSVPELFLGVSSALQGVPQISLGNILGGNFMGMTILIGISAIIARGIKMESKISSQNFWIIIFLALFPLLLAYDGMISREDGILLIVAYAIYVVKIFRDKEFFHKEAHTPHSHTHELHRRHLPRLWVKLAAGFILLSISAPALVWASRSLAEEFLSDQLVLFGIFFISIGTMLPDTIYAIRASRAGYPQTVVGNSLGSIAFTSTAIIGLVSIIHPIAITFDFHIISAFVFLLASFILFHLFVYTQSRITIQEGLSLIWLYVGFLLFNILLQ